MLLWAKTYRISKRAYLADDVKGLKERMAWEVV
jgi:hypothetical protein